MLDKAIAIVSKAFEGKFDKGGKPYVLHCLHVMNQMPQDDEDLMCVAVLHDLIEDTDWTFQDLIDEGFSRRVIDALRLLTHDLNVPYKEYVKAIYWNADARRVKIADLEHNSDITRMKGLKEKDFRRLAKYHESHSWLTGSWIHNGGHHPWHGKK